MAYMLPRLMPFSKKFKKLIYDDPFMQIVGYTPEKQSATEKHRGDGTFQLRPVMMHPSPGDKPQGTNPAEKGKAGGAQARKNEPVQISPPP